MGQQRGPGRGAQLATHRAAIHRHTSQQVGGRRGGHGHHTVRAAHRAAAHMDGRYDDLVGVQQMQRIAYAGHIGYRVQRPHFMVMHIAYRAAVRLGFGLGNRVIDRAGVCLDRIRQIQFVDNRRDMTGDGVMMVMMMLVVLMVRMMVLVLLLTVHGHTHVSARDAAGLGRFGGDVYARQAQAVHGMQKFFFVVQ